MSMSSKNTKTTTKTGLEFSFILLIKKKKKKISFYFRDHVLEIEGDKIPKLPENEYVLLRKLGKNFKI
jgi:hypothetical protein